MAKLLSMYRIFLVLLLAFTPSLYSAKSHLNSYSDSIYLENLRVQKPIPSSLKYTLWASAYVGSIYLLSRLDSADLALGSFYAIPALIPIYNWNSDTAKEEIALGGESLVLGTLSLYNYFVVKPRSQSSTKIFQDNINLNLILWTSLLYYRYKTESKSYLVIPVISKNESSIYLKTSF